jgi:hypothetical protein
MTARDILDRLPHKLFPSASAFYRRNYAALKRVGMVPVMARYDDAGNCRICGEAGRCPGWHTPEEVSTI